MPVFEQAVDAALVCVLDATDPSGEASIAGTAFAVSDDVLVTCHHVVDGLARLLLRTATGIETYATPADLITLPESDLALVRVVGLPVVPLPLAADDNGIVTRFWSKGFHRIGTAVRAAFPVEGNLVGTTAVSYRTASSDYLLSAVLVLRKEALGPGLSGAPVLDPDTGVVIGVISTRLKENDQAGGFAVPWTTARIHSQIEAVLEANRRDIPAYGRFLNLAGARALCRRQATRAQTELVTLRRVDLARRVDREAIHVALSGFLRSDAKLLPLIGPSGVGKSTELAAFVASSDQPILLLRGSATTVRDRDLGEVVASTLRESAGGLALPDQPELALPRLLADAGAPLLTLFDGLNEAPFDHMPLGDWLVRSWMWLRDTSGRLIVTSRPELWTLADRYIPDDLTMKDSHGGSVRSVTVSDFTDGESRLAAHVYGVAESLSNERVLRLPLMLRLYAETAERADVGDMSRVGANQLMEAYVADRCEAVSARQERPGFSHRVRERLQRAAAEMWERNSDALTAERFDALFTHEEGDTLLDEHVFVAAADGGYRFVFDDAADWLTSLSLDPDTELAPERLTQLDTQHGWRRAGALAYLLREVERHEGAAALRIRLEELMPDQRTIDTSADRTPPPYDDAPGVRLAREVLSTTSDALPYAAVLSKLAAREVKSQSYFPSTAFWRSLALPGPELLDLLHILAPASHDYLWRGKDWHLPYDRDANDDYASLSYELARRAPETAVPALRRWLDDSSVLYLGDREAKVRDVALGIMYRLLRDHSELVWRELAAAWPAGQLVFNYLLHDDPIFMAQCLLQHEAEAPEPMVMYMFALWPSLPKEAPGLRPQLLAVLERLYARTVDQRIRAEALARLVAESDDPRYVDLALDAFRSGDSPMSPSELAAGARLRPEAVLDAFEQALGRGGQQENVISAMRDMVDEAVMPDEADNLLLRHIQAHPTAAGSQAGWYVEVRLRSSPTATTALVHLAQAVIEHGNGSARRHLLYALTSPQALQDDATTRFLLLDVLVSAVTAASDTSTIQTGLEQFVMHRESLPGLDARTWRLLESVDPSKADRVVIAIAYTHPDFSRALVSWLAGRSKPLGPRTRQLLRLVDRGTSPPEAIAQVLDM